VAASSSSSPYFDRNEVVRGHMKCVETVSLGNRAWSMPRTFSPFRASNMQSGAPEQRVPTTSTSYRAISTPTDLLPL